MKKDFGGGGGEEYLMDKLECSFGWCPIVLIRDSLASFNIDHG